eukprot:CAMPEP_0175178824 /NCGR_PEP_ID=MMETSP0087-20121206/35180_1 /TAXON_ID=136419 /ORGANISM="Unknown Unknown, Strain D1" /LENGTH=284 /DNA_ID=CAMNT_0016471003 /DNA_START=65 /DNA_END=916 /DNA_ORIENTATION=-
MAAKLKTLHPREDQLPGTKLVLGELVEAIFPPAPPTQTTQEQGLSVERLKYIVVTCCMTFTDGSGIGIFSTAALGNHSCHPNVTRSISPNGVLSFRALKDIPAGTEILQSYVALFKPQAQRRDLLLKNYGFACQCVRCQPPSICCPSCGKTMVQRKQQLNSKISTCDGTAPSPERSKSDHEWVDSFIALLEGGLGEADVQAGVEQREQTKTTQDSELDDSISSANLEQNNWFCSSTNCASARSWVLVENKCRQLEAMLIKFVDSLKFGKTLPSADREKFVKKAA